MPKKLSKWGPEIVPKSRKITFQTFCDLPLAAMVRPGAPKRQPLATAISYKGLASNCVALQIHKTIKVGQGKHMCVYKNMFLQFCLMDHRDRQW